MLAAAGLVTLALGVRAAGRAVLAGQGRDARVVTALVVDVNRDDVATLSTLPGIGPTRARAIVLHRVRHGPFRRVDDLLAVDGLGPARVAALRPFLVRDAGTDAFP